MKASIYYLVKAKLIRNMVDGEIDFLEFNETFSSENPIEARDKAFEHYQNYIDVLLDGKGKSYTSDRQIREDLQTFINPGTGASNELEIGEMKLSFSDSYGNGMGVFLVILQPMKDAIWEDVRGDEFLIHGIGNMGQCTPQGMIDGLSHEFLYYEHFNYDTKNSQQDVSFYEYEIETSESSIILPTPFDWSGYDRPYLEEGTNPISGAITFSESDQFVLNNRITGGESNNVEFKPSLLYYYDKTGVGSGYRMYVKHVAARVICSFLNSNGGDLIIGVRDDGSVQGLKDDFSLARPVGKDPKDYFSLEFDKLVRDYFKGVSSNINGQFIELKGELVFAITVFPSVNRPVFINGKKGKEFYVRLQASSEPFLDIEQVTEYCLNKWGSSKS
ncbi:MAG: hypothetical protein ACJAYA_000771 [Bacteroidia bacterium]|jgi:hypothetical protein